MIRTIKQTLMFSLFVTMSFVAMPAKAEPDVKLMGTSDCFKGRFASYDSWMQMIAKMQGDKPGAEKFMSKVKAVYKKEDFESYRQNLDCKNVMYKVDDSVVHAYYVAPKNESDLPVIIYNRGGNASFGSWTFARVFSRLFNLATEGNVAIFASSYRGAFPKLPGEDEFGGADVKDVVALPQLFEHFPNVNPEKVGVFGASRGGMQSLLAVKQGLDVDSIVLYAGQYNLFEGLEHRPEMVRLYKERIPNYDEEKEAELKKRSAVFWMDEIDNDIPILLIHGEKDERVLVDSSIGLSKVLEKEGFTHKLSIYESGKHRYGKNAEAIEGEMLSWFKTNWK
ncbi:alpha/beta hydrolase family protein [Idiomarina abyssalis]|uniref:alpha/beta hydrolase family protein n=1 Tax=Idiomarina abyssalis TaxID=86102 RepID=UPI001CD4F836|nr:prolyl oligopeptidase family serine peptidase [Idiomarina abyssalis]